MRLFVGDDWAEDHHDVELMDASGRRLAKARLPEGVAGIARLHALVGEQLGEDADEEVGGGRRDRDRPRPVGAGADGGRVHGVWRSTPCSRPGTGSGTASPGPRATPGTRICWRTWCAPTPTSCGRWPGTRDLAEAVKVVTRAHKTLIWERTRHTQRLRHALRDYFPAALDAFEDLDAPDTLELLAKAPDPAVGGQADHRADHRGPQARPPPRHRRRRRSGSRPRCAPRIWASPPAVTAAYAASVRALVAVLATLE